MKLHLGSGKNVFQNWINIDIDQRANIVCDLSKGRLPFKNEEISTIYSEHFFEHLTREQGIELLKDCFRVLKKGGTIRISTPDLVALCEDYLAKKIDRWIPEGFSPATPCQMVNESVRNWGHQFIYDFNELQCSLSIAGFSSIVTKDWGVSAISDLNAIETRVSCRDLIIEAVKQ